MADFIQKANVKRSVRTLTTQIPDVATLNSLVQSIIDTNPFQCVDFVRGGVTNPGVSRGNESYTAKIVYEDAFAKNVGQATTTSTAALWTSRSATPRSLQP